MTLRLENISLKAGSQMLIYPTDLTLEPGSLNVLLGATLAGKTSLMRLMAGLEKPAGGQIFWNDVDVTNASVQKRDVAMVYQQFINYPTMSVYDNIASPLRLRGVKSVEIRKNVGDIAELLKLTPYLERKPLELSGGQQQRCALARSLVKDAGLVLLDEPLANLDYKLREELREEFPKIFGRSGSVFVYATTEPEEALLLGGNTATMSQGSITQFGISTDVYRNPNSLITATVYSNPPMNFLVVQKQGDNIVVNGNPIPFSDVLSGLSDGQYQVGFRAHDIKLEKSSASLGFKVRVRDSELSGSKTYLHLDYHDLNWVGLFRGVRPITTGEEITIFVNSDAFYLFNNQGALIKAAHKNEEAR